MAQAQALLQATHWNRAHRPASRYFSGCKSCHLATKDKRHFLARAPNIFIALEVVHHLGHTLEHLLCFISCGNGKQVLAQEDFKWFKAQQVQALQAGMLDAGSLQQCS